MIKKIYFLLIGCLCYLPNGNSQTIVTGSVLDAANREGIPFASISINGTTIGTVADELGNYTLTFEGDKNELLFSAVGYKKITKIVPLGTTQTLNIDLVADIQQLNEVVVNAGKYKNKGNPAVELIRKVIENKNQNRLESHDYYECNKYEKVEMNLVNVGDNVKNSRYLKNFQFVFDQTDTITLKGKKILPIYFNEQSSEILYRKTPESRKEYVVATRKSEFEGLLDADGVSDKIAQLYTNIDIYENAIFVLDTRFLSPIASLAPEFYRYYIIDTTEIEGKRCINLAFYPRNKTDLTFVGNLFVTDDSLFAVRKVKMGLPNDVNINFLNSLNVEQEFKQLPDGSWTLGRDEVSIDFGLSDKQEGFGVYGKKTTSYNQHLFNQPRKDEVYAGVQKVIRLYKEDKIKSQQDSFWLSARHEALNEKEKAIYTTIDSVQKVGDYKRFKQLSLVVFSSYLDCKTVEIGTLNTIYSFNAIEGNRLRLGGRTTKLFNKNIRLAGYGAYGLKDKQFKYRGLFTYQFNDNTFEAFPQDALLVKAAFDVEVPGQEGDLAYEDNFFNSFRRGVFDKLYYRRQLDIRYLKESEKGYAYEFGVNNYTLHPAGILKFERIDSQGQAQTMGSLNGTEASMKFTYAPNQVFFQGKRGRSRITNQHPIMDIQYRFGMVDLGKATIVPYHALKATYFKRFYVVPLGYTDVSMEAGKVWGRVPYPLLTTHRSNQTLAYIDNAYNLMNAMEFVSDKYVSLNISHFFEGAILNKIPLIKKLKLRQVVTFKGVYGGISSQNLPENSPETLFQLPVDASGKQQTFSLQNFPYLEGSVGISNIFKVLRVDYVRRFNYLDNPNVSKSGIRLKLRLEL